MDDADIEALLADTQLIINDRSDPILDSVQKERGTVADEWVSDEKRTPEQFASSACARRKLRVLSLPPSRHQSYCRGHVTSILWKICPGCARCLKGLLDGGPGGAVALASPVVVNGCGRALAKAPPRGGTVAAAACVLPPEMLKPRLLALHSSGALLLAWWVLHNPATRDVSPLLMALGSEVSRAAVALGALLRSRSTARAAALGPRWTLLPQRPGSSSGGGGSGGSGGWLSLEVLHLAAGALASVAASILFWKSAAHCDVRSLVVAPSRVRANDESVSVRAAMMRLLDPKAPPPITPLFAPGQACALAVAWEARAPFARLLFSPPFAAALGACHRFGSGAAAGGARKARAARRLCPCLREPRCRRGQSPWASRQHGHPHHRRRRRRSRHHRRGHRWSPARCRGCSGAVAWPWRWGWRWWRWPTAGTRRSRRRAGRPASPSRCALDALGRSALCHPVSTLRFR